MLNLRKIAVTGSLSCGKSSVCRFLRELGAYVVNADEVVHKLLNSKTDLGKAIINLLGYDILVKEHFDHSKIAQKVFNNAQLLQSLEKILHPPVFAEIDAEYKRASELGNVPLFVAEIPLLFETGGEGGYDATVAVYADPKLCCKRFMESTGQTEEEYNRRMSRQMKPEEKAKKANFVLLNNGSSEELRIATQKLFNQLCSEHNNFNK